MWSYYQDNHTKLVSLLRSAFTCIATRSACSEFSLRYIIDVYVRWVYSTVLEPRPHLECSSVQGVYLYM